MIKKINMRIVSTTLYVLFISLLFSCGKTEKENYLLDVDIPSNFPAMVYHLESNPITKNGFELGKKLFYDGKLAADNIVSCGFCHEQSYAFTHHGHQISLGVFDNAGMRNAQSIQNMAFQKEFMWDGAAIHLDLQPIIPLTSDLEMGETVGNVISKLKNDDAYPKAFAEAFDDGEINSENLFKALSQFMVMMISGDSKYDKMIREEEGVKFSDNEQAGYALFQNKCGQCHSGELFTDQNYRNNGLPINPKYNDEGRKKVTELEVDKYKFKVPSLRNIEFTAPYMHDGRFNSLESVLNFYESGITHTTNLDPLLINADGDLGISLSEIEKVQIIAFLKTLSDHTFLNDKRFSEY